MNPHFEKFVNTFRKMLMLDQADLDFGIYRIMKEKREEIDRYLTGTLPNQVKELLAANTSSHTVELQQQLEQTIAQVRALGYEPDTNPKVISLREEIAKAGNSDELESNVYTHLTTFFSRYYEGGDFISQRRYKKDVYAIPYEGEEVKLHWANADQYYIKTAEYFRDYSFKLSDDKRVEFTLKDVTTEQNNNLAQNNMERRFALYEDEPITIDCDTLHINFTYELYPKATKQKQLIEAAYQMVRGMLPTAFAELLSLRPTESDRNRTLLQKHLNDYVARNTFDYFIHKDLQGFLTRELDFYIKNEILVIDDINARSTEEFVAHLTEIKAIKAVGNSLIQFLAQLENFQKRLWLKKKMVVQADYCITLDRVPEELYADICANDRQREEWVRLFAIDEIQSNGMFGTGYSVPLTEQFLKENPFLVLDTAFFTEDFKHKLIAFIDNLDEQCDGLMINSDNFQALHLLIEKYAERIDTIYIDPPYNTSASEILYKNSYKHSSWLSLLADRIKIGKEILSNEGVQCTTIDDVEGSRLRILLEDIYEENPMVVGIRVKPSGRPIPNGFAISHEYAFFSRKSDTTSIRRLQHSDNQNSRYRESDSKGAFFWELLRKAGSNSFRHNRPTMYFPIYLDVQTGKMRIPEMEYDSVKEEYLVKELTNSYEVAIYPIKDDGSQGCWYFGLERAIVEVPEFKAEKQSDGTYFVYRRRRKNDGVQPTTFWDSSKYSATEHGTDLLKKIFGEQEVFSYPKSIFAEEDCLTVAGSDSESITLDYFAGSGTTGHAVINLNRADNGKRKYILVEMGTYFDTVTKPRIQRVIYSEDWNNGKPVSRKGSSHCFKYMRLEQYEDTLNNLVTVPNTLAAEGQFYDGFLLGYMLDLETRDSLFNQEWFKNPFDMKLRITRNNEMKEKVDLVETFNYLIGLFVDQIAYPKTGICTVTGRTRQGKKALVIWRDCNAVSNEQLNDFFRRSAYSVRDNEYDVIYVNGDNNLDNLRAENEAWKVVLIEQEFNRQMFNS